MKMWRQRSYFSSRKSCEVYLFETWIWGQQTNSWYFLLKRRAYEIILLCRILLNYKFYNCFHALSFSSEIQSDSCWYWSAPFETEGMSVQQIVLQSCMFTILYVYKHARRRWGIKVASYFLAISQAKEGRQKFPPNRKRNLLKTRSSNRKQQSSDSNFKLNNNHWILR